MVLYFYSDIQIYNLVPLKRESYKTTLITFKIFKILYFVVLKNVNHSLSDLSILEKVYCFVNKRTSVQAHGGFKQNKFNPFRGRVHWLTLDGLWENKNPL